MARAAHTNFSGEPSLTAGRAMAVVRPDVESYINGMSTDWALDQDASWRDVGHSFTTCSRGLALVESAMLVSSGLY